MDLNITFTTDVVKTTAKDAPPTQYVPRPEVIKPDVGSLDGPEILDQLGPLEVGGLSAGSDVITPGGGDGVDGY